MIMVSKENNIKGVGLSIFFPSILQFLRHNHVVANATMSSLRYFENHICIVFCAKSEEVKPH